MMKVGWRSECRWLESRVADGRCVRRHLGVVCGLLSLGVVVLCGEELMRSWRNRTSGHTLCRGGLLC